MRPSQAALSVIAEGPERVFHLLPLVFRHLLARADDAVFLQLVINAGGLDAQEAGSFLFHAVGLFVGPENQLALQIVQGLGQRDTC